MNLPPLARVRQLIPQPRVDDVPARIRRLILESRIRERVPAGGMVALGIGSRGIAGIAGMARAAVDTLKELGYKPFIVAAMGSHGGATAEGQRALLASFDVTAEAMGVAVKTDMDAVVLGTNPVGLPIYFDRNAHQADGVVLINRVKPHTDFHATHESGVLKMLVLGLGKREGASQVHRLGLRGMKEVLPAVGRFLVENTRFALGLAVLENADDEPAEIVPIEPETIFDVEPKLLERARGLMGRLPFDQIDVLIVGELGKNYSGAGMDPNVIGRLMVETQSDFERPVITRLAVLDVSDESHGNIVGVGFADLTTQRLVSRMAPRAVPDQRPDLMFPRAGADPDHPANRPRGDRECSRDLLAHRLRHGPDGCDPQHAGAEDAVGLAASGRRGSQSSSSEAGYRVSSHSALTRRHARPGCDVPAQYSRVAGEGKSLVDSPGRRSRQGDAP